jgi:hypothetical protein
MILYFKPKLIMKQIKALILFCTLLAFVSCQKSDIQKPADNLSINSTDEVSLSQEGYLFTLSLRPGPMKGSDVYVVQQQGVKSGNTNYVPELSISSWTVDGAPYTSASLLKFDNLNKIPQSSKVLSAELHLYGLSSSESTPQGNYGNNSCFIKRITAPWNDNTVTFPTKPSTTTEDEVTLPASTSQWNYNPVVDVTKLVSYMVAHPNQNFGFYIRLKKQEIYRSLVFGSCEQSNSNLRPKLVVKFE